MENTLQVDLVLEERIESCVHNWTRTRIGALRVAQEEAASLSLFIVVEPRLSSYDKNYQLIILYIYYYYPTQHIMHNYFIFYMA